MCLYVNVIHWCPLTNQFYICQPYPLGKDFYKKITNGESIEVKILSLVACLQNGKDLVTKTMVYEYSRQQGIILPLSELVMVWERLIETFFLIKHETEDGFFLGPKAMEKLEPWTKQKTISFK